MLCHWKKHLKRIENLIYIFWSRAVGCTMGICTISSLLLLVCFTSLGKGQSQGANFHFFSFHFLVCHINNVKSFPERSFKHWIPEFLRFYCTSWLVIYALFSLWILFHLCISKSMYGFVLYVFIYHLLLYISFKYYYPMTWMIGILGKVLLSDVMFLKLKWTLKQWKDSRFISLMVVQGQNS